MSDQPYHNTEYTQQQRPPPSWHQHIGRGGFRDGARGGYRGSTRGFSRGRGRGRGGGGGGVRYKQAFFSDNLDFDKTVPLDYSVDTLQQHYESYYSPLFSQNPWTTSPS